MFYCKSDWFSYCCLPANIQHMIMRIKENFTVILKHCLLLRKTPCKVLKNVFCPEKSLKVHMKRNQFFYTIPYTLFQSLNRVWKKNWQFYNTWKLCNFVLKNGLWIMRPKCPDDVMRYCNAIQRVLAIHNINISFEDSEKSLNSESLDMLFCLRNPS